MRLALLLACLALAPAGGAWAQAPAAPGSGAGPQVAATLPEAVQFDMPSRFSGRTYRIYVNRPSTPPPVGGYPVLLVLDGDSAFPIAARQTAGSVLGGGRAALVVGVAYPDVTYAETLRLRTRDLTFTAQATSGRTATAGTRLEDTGGGEAFRRFLDEELRPALAARYPVNAKDQSLIGYSLGGLFALHVLFRHPQSYRAYVLGSPSIWWNDEEVLAQEAKFAASVTAGQVAPRILITSAGLEQSTDAPGLPPPGPRRDEIISRIAAARMVDNARALADRLKALKGGPGYEVRYAVFADETHNSGQPAAVSRGVRFILAP